MRRAAPTRFDIEVRSSGVLTHTHSSRLASGRHFRDAERETGIPADHLRARRGEVGSETGSEITFDWGEDAPPFAARLRGLNEPDTQAVTFADTDPLVALRAALDCTDHPSPEPVIYWTGTDRLAAVDLDYHGIPYADRPTPVQLRALADLVEPRPRVVWSTHGRGLRLMYADRPGDGFTAGELAGVAALWLVSRDTTARVEIKSITRHPGYARGAQECGRVDWLTGDCEIGSVRSWLGRQEASDAEVVEWMESRGLVKGQRYPHDKCPARPDEPGGRDPVTVHDSGVYCYRCAGVGVTQGSRRPGWFPWGSLCGSVIASTLSTCLRNFTHWEHARFIVEDATGLTGEVARFAYVAALKLLHGADDPRIPLVAVKGTNLVRLQAGWAHLDGCIYIQHEPILAALPAALALDADRRPVQSRENSAKLLQNTDLTPLGYPSLTPVWGARIYTHSLPPRNTLTVPIVIHTPDLSSAANTAFRPRYLPPQIRGDAEDAWKTLERILPGLNRDYLQLLIAARGCVEGEGGLPPMIFACGPTGASKTATIHVAAAVIGDTATEIVWSRDTERLRQALQNAKESGTFAVFNEFIKDSERTRAGEGSDGSVSAMDFVLNLTPNSTSHALYRGPVRLGTPPVCVWTDTRIPDYVRQSAQVARRIVGVELGASVHWVDSLADAGITRPTAIRTQGGPLIARACDTILSGVIDRFFRVPQDFVRIAQTLGFQLLCDTQSAIDGRKKVRDFFDALTYSPPAPELIGRRFGGRGWVPIPLAGDTELANLWRDLADPGGKSSMRLGEVDVACLLRVPGPITFEVRTHGQALYARFIRRTADRLVYMVNRELLPGDVPPPEVPTAPLVDDRDLWKQDFSTWAFMPPGA